MVVCLVGFNLVSGCVMPHSYKRFGLGKTEYIRNKKKKKNRASSQWEDFDTDVRPPHALVTDRTGLVRGPGGRVPGPDTSLSF